MAAIGDMDQFLKYKAALAMEAAADNPGGEASTGVGMGAGMGMGFMLPQMLSGAMQSGYGQGQQSVSPMDKLKKLKELLDIGALSQEEYDNKRKKLLEKI
jgi:membrane protease subunit (stomatin/prohibitin family)